MGESRDRLTDQIRKAIDAGTWSRYAICKSIGLSQSTMSRFMHGQGGLSCEMLDRIADVLDLNIEAGTPLAPPARQKTGPKPGRSGRKGK